MKNTANQFVGNIPEHYDTGLGPYIFDEYAQILAGRVAALGAGHMLELAAGTGIVSRKLRDQMADDARMIVTDLNAPMLAVAQSKFHPDENVAFQTADAMALPFGDATFDAVVCQFGVMFFPDKIASMKEAKRVLKPGGRYLFNTWGTMDENPFSRIAHRVSAQFFPDNPPGFYLVPFSYADPDDVVPDMLEAGFDDIETYAIPLRKTVDDVAAFARGLVFGNPLIDEIQARGGIDPRDVQAEIHAAMTSEFGSSPAIMDLKASVFSGRSA